MQSFTAADIEGTLLASLCFPVVLFVPGYICGWITGLLNFRQGSLPNRVLVSLVLSVSISPIFVNLLARVASAQACAFLFLLMSFAFVILVFQERKWWRAQIGNRLSRSAIIAVFLGVLWIGVCLFALVDLQIGNRLYSSVTLFDNGVRAALISSAERSGAPPANPFFYFRGAPPARYYYYWNVLCAIPAILSRAGPRCTLFASSIWAGFALAALIPLYLRHFLGQRQNLVEPA